MTDNFERALQERLQARSQVSPPDVEALRRFTRTLPARRGSWRTLWQRPTTQWAFSAAAVLVFAVVLIPLLSRGLGFGVASPAPSPSPSSPPIGPAPSPLVP